MTQTGTEKKYAQVSVKLDNGSVEWTLVRVGRETWRADIIRQLGPTKDFKYVYFNVYDLIEKMSEVEALEFIQDIATHVKQTAKE